MSDNGGDGTAGSAMTARLVVSWLLIVILLGYGVVQTAITAAKLFQ